SGRAGRTTLFAALAVVMASGVGSALRLRHDTLARSTRGRMMMFAAGDTTVVFGPVHLVAPASGGGNNYVEAFTVSNPVPARPSGGSSETATGGAARVTHASLRRKGVPVFTSSQFTSGPATLSKSEELLVADTMLVTVTGPANAAMDVSVISLPDPTYMF